MATLTLYRKTGFSIPIWLTLQWDELSIQLFSLAVGLTNKSTAAKLGMSISINSTDFRIAIACYRTLTFSVIFGNNFSYAPKWRMKLHQYFLTYRTCRATVCYVSTTQDNDVKIPAVWLDWMFLYQISPAPDTWVGYKGMLELSKVNMTSVYDKMSNVRNVSPCRVMLTRATVSLFGITIGDPMSTIKVRWDTFPVMLNNHPYYVHTKYTMSGSITPDMEVKWVERITGLLDIISTTPPPESTICHGTIKEALGKGVPIAGTDIRFRLFKTREEATNQRRNSPEGIGLLPLVVTLNHNKSNT